MPKTQHEEEQKEKQKQGREHLKALIGKQVMHILGQPGDLYRLQVRHLWEDHYRVNILVGANPDSVKIAYSYFLVADKEGTILASMPKMTKKY
jgi:hypothetical protein